MEIAEDRKPLILIVDDTAKNLQLLGNILKENEYKISVANSGKQAIAIAKEIMPDLILLDVMMPEMDGFETCIKLKDSAETRTIPIIFLTAKVEPEDIMQGFKIGAVDYITKPFNPYELKARVKTHLDLKISRDLLHDKVMQLDKEKNMLETILKGIGDGVLVVDSNFHITMFNPQASRISGFSEKEALGRSYEDILKFTSESERHKFNGEFIKDAIIQKEIKEINNPKLIVNKKNEKIPFTAIAVPLSDEEGQVMGCVVVLRDLTKELIVDKMKCEFVSIASHQLKTPLTGIKWMTELLLRCNLNKEQMEYASEAHKSANRMVKLIDELLDISHIDTGRKFEIKKEKADIIELIDSVIEELVENAGKKNISITKSKRTPVRLIAEIDLSKIRQVITNLVDNAIKYSKNNSKVEVECTRNEGKLSVSVKDNGIGIPAEQQKRLFEKFYRADNAVLSETDGTGLGLYIAKAIVEAHGGKIQFESVEGKGTTFYVELI